MWLVLQKLSLKPGRGDVLHFAPERALATKLAAMFGEGYTACDVDPIKYNWDFAQVYSFDLCTDLFDLQSESIDLVLHSHVLEHIACNPAIAFLELNRVLRKGGHHLFSLPLYAQDHKENLSPKLTKEQKKQEFGQHDHVRVFGLNDFPLLLRSVFRGFREIKASSLVKEQEAIDAGIPVEALRTLNGHSVFCFQKE